MITHGGWKIWLFIFGVRLIQVMQLVYGMIWGGMMGMMSMCIKCTLLDWNQEQLINVKPILQ
ncbi:MAG: hypothetical protein FWH36_08880 [Lentimicrobiaceae bacterium]|nr:hypothetical protein [Lentimicrobiaceae bacterium]